MIFEYKTSNTHNRIKEKRNWVQQILRRRKKVITQIYPSIKLYRCNFSKFKFFLFCTCITRYVDTYIELPLDKTF